jgi:hypothetical protein
MTQKTDSDSATAERPNTARILAALKPFQRQSVDYVFDRLYGTGYTRRFLLADEVGLGKTLVARGVIARAIDQLWDKGGRFDVVYICSNHDIARQNINRLNVTGKKDFALASRITLLPITKGGGVLRGQRLNFVSFTPGTSFDLKSNLGVSTERVLLYHMLKDAWSFRGAAPRNVLQGDSGADSFRRQVDDFPHHDKIDTEMSDLFLRHLREYPALKNRFDELCGEYHRADAKVTDEVSSQRSALVGDLRAALAHACLHALKPDLNGRAQSRANRGTGLQPVRSGTPEPWAVLGPKSKSGEMRNALLPRGGKDRSTRASWLGYAPTPLSTAATRVKNPCHDGA